MTIYSRPQCGLCDEAKQSISKATKKLPSFDLLQVDILLPENKEWFDKYAFDVPVIHFQTAENSPVHKIMHHIHEKDVVQLVESSLNETS
ncbi:uncharacterized protein V2V93DRAFT_391976 [Kockiozyma suomiensis]|uniref:uncharacterized protein n=1 Tax=Kockiozyma suomiensis TaxID=1337062 RepID=UPI003343A44C